MTEVHNPILSGCYPDPSICRVGADYYLVTSTFEYFPGLPIFKSRDLVSWDQIGHVVDRPGQLNFAGIRSSGGLFAPTLRFHNGIFWLVCTLVGQPDGEPGGNFLMTAADPAGPWSDPVWLGVEGIDPSIFFDDDGRAWVHGTRLVAEPAWHDQTEVWIRELDLVSLALIGPEHVVWNGAVTGAVWCEAPHLYQVNGKYYLLTAEGGTAFHHAVSVARADTVTGPYTGCRANPIFSHRQLGYGADVVGVGHADLVEATDGSWWAVLLGTRQHDGYGPLGRETFLVPVEWQDGWPVFAPKVGQITTSVDLPWAAAEVPGITQGETSGIVPPADLRWTSVRGPAAEFAAPEGLGWRLTMLPTTLTARDTPAFLALRHQHLAVDVRVTLDAVLSVGEEVGVAVRQSEDDQLRVFLRRDDSDNLTLGAVHRQGGVDIPLGEPTAGPTGAVTFVVQARGAELTLLCGPTGTAPALVATADGRTLDSTATGGFLGLWTGVYATSGGRPTNTTVLVRSVEYLPAE